MNYTNSLDHVTIVQKKHATAYSGACSRFSGYAGKFELTFQKTELTYKLFFKTLFSVLFK